MLHVALIVFAVACIFVCSRLRTRRGAALFAVAIFLFLLLGVPFGELAHKCLEPISEGCVWGKSLLPLSLAVGAVLGAVMGGGAYLLSLGFQRRRRLAGERADSAAR